MSKQAPRLDSGLIARKGEAAPAVTSSSVTVSEPIPVSPTRSPVPKGVSGTIAVTVRLDPERYERMKIHGVRQRHTNQEILVAALDAYLLSTTGTETRRRREVILMGDLTDEDAKALAKAEMSPEHLRFYDKEPE